MKTKYTLLSLIILLAGCISDQIQKHDWTNAEHICKEDEGVKLAWRIWNFAGGQSLKVVCNSGGVYTVTSSGWLSTKENEDG